MLMKRESQVNSGLENVSVICNKMIVDHYQFVLSSGNLSTEIGPRS